MKLEMPRFDQARVLVLGDIMLDRYWHGGASRISPEAPVPVVKVDQLEDRVGASERAGRRICRSLKTTEHLAGSGIPMGEPESMDLRDLDRGQLCCRQQCNRRCRHRRVGVSSFRVGFFRSMERLWRCDRTHTGDRVEAANLQSGDGKSAARFRSVADGCTVIRNEASDA